MDLRVTNNISFEVIEEETLVNQLMMFGIVLLRAQAAQVEGKDDVVGRSGVKFLILGMCPFFPLFPIRIFFFYLYLIIEV